MCFLGIKSTIICICRNVIENIYAFCHCNSVLHLGHPGRFVTCSEWGSLGVQFSGLERCARRDVLVDLSVSKWDQVGSCLTRCLTRPGSVFLGRAHLHILKGVLQCFRVHFCACFLLLSQLNDAPVNIIWHRVNKAFLAPLFTFAILPSSKTPFSAKTHCLENK